VGIAALSVGIALVALASVLFAATLGVSGRADFLVASLVLAAAMVVGEAILLSLVRELTREALLAAQMLWLAAAFGLWQQRGRPRPPSFRPPSARTLLRGARTHPLLATLLLVVVLALTFEATLAVTVAPNEYDTLGYHLPRAAFWLQYHSALQFNPGEVGEEQVAPPNAELLIAWTMALSRSDRFAQLVQWLALVGLLAAIFSGSRLAEIARSHAAFLAGLFALYPVTLLESATGQNDIVLAFFLTAAVVFAVSGTRQRALGRLIVASLAGGLAIGTKLDVALALPAVLLILLATWRAERPPRRLVLHGLALTLAAAAALGSFVYVQNIVNTGTVTGFSGTPPGDWVKTNPLADAAQDAWNLLDAPGLPQPAWLAHPLQHLANRLFADVHGADFQVPPSPAIRREADPDTSAYGLVGLLLVAPLVLIALVWRRTPGALRVLALGAVSYFVVCTLVLGYSDEDGRFLMPAFVLATPLLVLLVRRRGGAFVALALALLTLPGTLLHDVYKPVLATEGAPSIFSLDRIGEQTIDNDLAPLGPPLHRLNAIVRPHDALGFLYQEGFPEYLLFGEPLQRRLVGFSEPNQVSAQALRSKGLRGLFIAFADRPPCNGDRCIPHASGLHFVPLGGASYFVTAAASAPWKAKSR
jgi:Dolichyl-phosphate-mannose-protein mannosyltransferase